MSILDQGEFQDIVKNTLPQPWCHPTLQLDHTQKSTWQNKKCIQCDLEVFV